MDNVILLRAYKPEKNPEIVVRPVQDETGNTFTGQGPEGGYFEELSEEDKKKMPYVVTPQTGIKITNGHVFYLDRKKDSIDWQWVQKHPYITLKQFESENKPADAAFYVHNAAKAAKLSVSKERQRVALMAKVYDLSEEEQRKLAAAAGLGDTSGLSIDEVIDYLQNTVHNEYARVEALMKDKGGVEAQVILNNALARNIVVKTRGWYKFDDVNLGNGEAQAVEFLKNPENNDIVLAIRASVENIE